VTCPAQNPTMAQIPTASAQLRSKPIPQSEPTPVKLLSELAAGGIADANLARILGSLWCRNPKTL
jgi:hypothetical protein